MHFSRALPPISAERHMGKSFNSSCSVVQQRKNIVVAISVSFGLFYNSSVLYKIVIERRMTKKRKKKVMSF
jgi:hypothetical protein